MVNESQLLTRSGLVLDGPTVPMPPPFINPEEDERVEETLNDPRSCGNIIENLLNLDKIKDLPPYHDNPSTYLASDSFPSGNDDLVDTIPEEFTNELVLITFPPGNDDITLEDVIKDMVLNNPPLA
ncbi:hypothetical protein Tco_0158380 [Tanacetum coccineum]